MLLETLFDIKIVRGTLELSVIYFLGCNWNRVIKDQFVMFQIGARALILSPTRELATQTIKFTKEVCTYVNKLGNPKPINFVAQLNNNECYIGLENDTKTSHSNGGCLCFFSLENSQICGRLLLSVETGMLLSVYLLCSLPDPPPSLSLPLSSLSLSLLPSPPLSSPSSPTVWKNSLLAYTETLTCK